MKLYVKRVTILMRRHLQKVFQVFPLYSYFYIVVWYMVYYFLDLLKILNVICIKKETLLHIVLSSSATMFRSDEYYINLSPTRKSAQQLDDNVPVYDPVSQDGMKKEHCKSSGESTIHLIPLVLIFCGFVLWFFSHPPSEIKEISSTM
ncbi:hypothetical protein QVD17_26395 [Tagetes erecta]|uniref:Uncharacterized protein n=1 Tax=Tagetes erecta TaxID=13708 RepID=A0AAD8K7D2_TARER|nr:hypothetical protein QVD17_26395 [Tagetes erecta]